MLLGYVGFCCAGFDWWFCLLVLAIEFRGYVGFGLVLLYCGLALLPGCLCASLFALAVCLYLLSCGLIAHGFSVVIA